MNESVYLIHCPPGWLKTPPLGCEYIKEYLRSQGYETSVIDLNASLFTLLKEDKRLWHTLDSDFESNLYLRLEREYPGMLADFIHILRKAKAIGMSLTKRNKRFTLNLARLIKKQYPSLPVVLGGPETMFMLLRNEPFDPAFKWVVGEGERAFLNILKGHRSQLTSYEEIQDLDTLPLCTFKGFKLSLYTKTLPLLSSRGCIKKCSFCTENRLFRHAFRQHSPQYMVDQIRLLKTRCGIDWFVFHDSLINANLQWLEEFCRRLIKRNLDIRWQAQAIVRRDFDEHLAVLLKRSGCFNLFVGLESASDKILSAMGKGYTQEDSLVFFNALNRVGLHFEVSLIFGFPGENKDDYKATVDFIIKNKRIIPKLAQANPYVDYFSPNKNATNTCICKRVQRFMEIVEREKIAYTKPYINNLIYC